MNRRDFLKIGMAAAAGGVTVSFLGPVAAAAAPDVAQVTAAQRFKIGDIVVTAVSDGYLDLKQAIFTNLSEAEFQAALKDAFLKPDAYRISVNAFILDTGSKIYMVDAGTGNNYSPTLGRLEANLVAAGYQPSAVSALLATHLHPDHIGGSFKEGKPVFPAAEFVVSDIERGFWSDAGNRANAPEAARAFFDFATNSLKAYGERLRPIKGEASVAPGITAVPLPGHTPGHTGYRIESAGETLMFWADVVHCAPVQLPRPEITLNFDVDQPLAARTRKALLEQVVSERTLVAGAHLPFPGIGHIEKAQTGYRFVPASWDYL